MPDLDRFSKMLWPTYLAESARFRASEQCDYSCLWVCLGHLGVCSCHFACFCLGFSSATSCLPRRRCAHSARICGLLPSSLTIFATSFPGRTTRTYLATLHSGVVPYWRSIIYSFHSPQNVSRTSFGPKENKQRNLDYLGCLICIVSTCHGYLFYGLNPFKMV